MGAAESKNVAEAVANVSNFVTNSTSANASQANVIENNVDINKCFVKGDVNVKEVASSFQTNTQTTKALNNNSISNNIQQQMTQSAESKVGTLGIGYASASNAANQLINDTNQIENSIKEVSNQYGYVKQSFTCNDSYIGGNVNIDFSNNSQFISDQVLDQTTTNGIVNDISQSIDQKAKATVEGIGSLLLILAIIIGVIIYSVGRTLDTAPVKIAVTAIVVVVCISILAWNYVGQKPPFFNKPNECLPKSDIGCGSECINLKQSDLTLKQPPTKYLFSLNDLAKMVVSKASFNGKSNGDNLGYRVDTFNAIEQELGDINEEIKKLGIDPIPNPLTVPMKNNKFYGIPDVFKQLTAPDLAGICTPAYCNIDDVVRDRPTDCKQGQCCYEKWSESWWSDKDMTETPSLGIANFNSDGINNYLVIPSGSTPEQKEIHKKRVFAMRLVYATLLNLETRFYVDDIDLFSYVNDNGNMVILFGKDNDGNGYLYKPTKPLISYIDKVDGSGTITGKIGVCNDNNYKFQNFMRKIGIWIILLIFLLPIIYMFVNRKKKEDAK